MLSSEKLTIKIVRLDLLIDEVLIDITEDDTLSKMDESWAADKTASILQAYLDKLKYRLTEGATE